MDVLRKHYLKIDACKFEVIKPLKFDVRKKSIQTSLIY